MRAIAPFTVSSFVPAQLSPVPAEVETGLPVGTAILTKEFDGQITGSSVTIFTAAFDQEANVGTYVAMESFEGTVNGMLGTLNFVHSATTTDGSDRLDEFFTIVPGSGTGELEGITGTGGLRANDDEHTIWFEYEMPHD